MTDELKRWLKEYLHWVKQGAPPHPDFRRDHGLCIQPSMRDAELVAELKWLLIRTCGTDLYPFDDHVTCYWNAVENKSQHLNERRIEWVERMVS